MFLDSTEELISVISDLTHILFNGFLEMMTAADDTVEGDFTTSILHIPDLSKNQRRRRRLKENKMRREAEEEIRKEENQHDQHNLTTPNHELLNQAFVTSSILQMPDQLTKNQRRRRRLKENKKRREAEEERRIKENQHDQHYLTSELKNGLMDPQNSDSQSKPKKKKNKRRKSNKKNKKKKSSLDRYFGLFHCKLCNRTWASAHVFVASGTEKVVWRQRCKKCPDGWFFPFDKQMIRCGICDMTPCVCTCEFCNKLLHRPPAKKGNTPTDSKDRDDDRQLYCRCTKKKHRDIGSRMDPKKGHLVECCEKCLQGLPCTDNGED